MGILVTTITPTILAETLPCSQTIEKLVSLVASHFQDFMSPKLESTECNRVALCKSIMKNLRAGRSSREIPSITLSFPKNSTVSNAVQTVTQVPDTGETDTNIVVKPKINASTSSLHRRNTYKYCGEKREYKWPLRGYPYSLVKLQTFVHTLPKLAD